MKSYNEKGNKITRIIQSFEKQIEYLKKMIMEFEKNPPPEENAELNEKQQTAAEDEKQK